MSVCPRSLRGARQRYAVECAMNDSVSDVGGARGRTTACGSVGLAEAASPGLGWERRACAHALPGTGTRPFTTRGPLMAMRWDTHSRNVPLASRVLQEPFAARACASLPSCWAPAWPISPVRVALRPHVRPGPAAASSASEAAVWGSCLCADCPETLLQPGLLYPVCALSFCTLRFPVVIAQFLALRNYTLFHNEL